jgi:hypothetical protein
MTSHRTFGARFRQKSYGKSFSRQPDNRARMPGAAKTPETCFTAWRAGNYGRKAGVFSRGHVDRFLCLGGKARVVRFPPVARASPMNQNKPGGARARGLLA